MKNRVFCVLVLAIVSLGLIQGYEENYRDKKSKIDTLDRLLSKTFEDEEANKKEHSIRSFLPVCTDTCEYAADTDCDDGGADSDYNVCQYGSDCTDCGPRYSPPPVCSDICTYAGDGTCDDNGPGSVYGFCSLGSDCSDCGSRDIGETEYEGCSFTCYWSDDGECDDGGIGATYADCEFGTDCADCGVRHVCDELCEWSGDAVCDDGGSGAVYNVCALGTDCTDCGPRE
ncbi:uncharacterized protein [Ptychodera flava]|uniref:uncharacterized protein n=1 Tax=Ptychodera flava TaxID=63121 RepID=UPI00396A5D3A